MKKKRQDRDSAKLAKTLAVTCVRHTFLEDLHGGPPVLSKTGDYSDVKVIDATGRERPWNKVSRITQDEMKKLMKQIVNKLYTVLMSLDNDEVMNLLYHWGHVLTPHWDDPEFLPTFLKPFDPTDERSSLMPLATNQRQPPAMDYDNDKVDNAALALLHLTMWDDRTETRAWKSYDWAVMDRLHQKGYIADPEGKAKSVAITEEGKTQAEQMFRRLFAKTS